MSFPIDTEVDIKSIKSLYAPVEKMLLQTPSSINIAGQIP